MFKMPIGDIIIGTTTGIGILVGAGTLGMALVGDGVGILGMVLTGDGVGIIGTDLTGDGMVGTEIIGTTIIVQTEEETDCMEDTQMVVIIITLVEIIGIQTITLATETPTEVTTEVAILTL